MKKFIVFMMFIAVGGMAIAAEANASDPTKIKMDEFESSNNADFEREICFHIVEAMLYTDLKQVEITLCGIGEAEVYIVNQQNQVINATAVNTDFPMTFTMDVTGGKGSYQIIVVSDRCYAEGRFIIE